MIPLLLKVIIMHREAPWPLVLEVTSVVGDLSVSAARAPAATPVPPLKALPVTTEEAGSFDFSNHVDVLQCGVMVE